MSEKPQEQCPSYEELDAYVRGVCNAVAAAAISEHIKGCASCDVWVREERANVDAGKGLADGTGEWPVPPPPAEHTIGPYRLIQRLGEGGMGEVFLAEQRGAVRRQVAVKLIKKGLDSKKVLARFAAERQALAMLNHPNIAHMYDAAQTSDGRPFFVMEYVRGVPITRYCDEQKLNTTERLKLFLPLCAAIQHAHGKRLVHRDLKPANVLVTLQDGRPTPKVIDFGVAKALDFRLTEETLFTEFGQFVGTPEYMSPEQARTSPLDVDERTDIYSLGVLLYELLVGAVPLELRKKAVDEVIRTICEIDPPTPSTRISRLGGASDEISKNRRTDPQTLRRLLHSDLEWIPMKALEKERGRRYASVEGLAEDIQNYLEGKPLHARPPSLGSRLTRSFRRHRSRYLTASALAIIVLFFSVIVWQMICDARTTELVEQGNRHFESHELDKAEACYQQAMEWVPNKSRRADIQQGLAAAILDQFFKKSYQDRNPALLERSKAILAEAQAANPSSDVLSKIHDGWVPVHCLLREFDKAEVAGREAVSIEPNAYWAKSNLARVFAIQSRFGEALELATQASNIKPPASDHDEFTDDPWGVKGTIEMHLGNWGAAMQSLKKARELDKKDPLNRILLARLFSTAPGAARDNEAAFGQAYIATEIAEFPYPQSQRILAYSLLCVGAPKNAIEHAEKAVEEGDKRAYNHLIKAIAHARLGDLNQARQCRDKAVNDWPPEFKSARVVADIDSYLMLWIDTADELEALKKEADEAIRACEASPPRP